ncbi:MAG: Asp-tRNA(Asn)/Glu-tRNA(Gln) amidotransferase subunit GatC [Dehalococcoidia bacterium]|nr:Asp-tRNA(Asn)/Glu-tRNA(Gln) amidotransferase subunit GatC [Dehalococcoidia bacterium]
MLTPEEVRHIAQLVRIRVTDQEVDQFTSQLSDILDQFTKLDELDTSEVPATRHTLPLHNVLREDVAEESLTAEQATANAPLKEAGHFRVRAVLEF